MFANDPFDIAPRPDHRRRLRSLVLLLGLLALLAGGFMYERQVRAQEEAEAQARAKRALARKQAAQEAAAKARAADPAELAKARELAQLQRKLRISWTGLFDALEHAGHRANGRVSVASLAPLAAGSDGPAVAISARAASSDAMVEYIGLLQGDPAVRQVRLASHQPAQEGAAEVVRFQVVVLWKPTETHGRTAATGLDWTYSLPPSGTQLDDVSLLFRVAKTQAVKVGPITYRTDPVPSLPLVIRTLEVRLDEDYPKVKPLLAELLRRMPHMAIEEVRVEQVQAATGALQANLRLSLLYRVEGAP